MYFWTQYDGLVGKLKMFIFHDFLRIEMLISEQLIDDLLTLLTFQGNEYIEGGREELQWWQNLGYYWIGPIQWMWHEESYVPVPGIASSFMEKKGCSTQNRNSCTEKRKLS